MWPLQVGSFRRSSECLIPFSFRRHPTRSTEAELPPHCVGSPGDKVQVRGAGALCATVIWAIGNIVTFRTIESKNRISESLILALFFLKSLVLIKSFNQPFAHLLLISLNTALLYLIYFILHILGFFLYYYCFISSSAHYYYYFFVSLFHHFITCIAQSPLMIIFLYCPIMLQLLEFPLVRQITDLLSLILSHSFHVQKLKQNCVKPHWNWPELNYNRTKTELKLRQNNT